MKVKLLISVGFDGKSHPKGAEIDVSTDVGNGLVIGKKAIEVKETKIKKKKNKK
jgi:hypothetical protein